MADKIKYESLHHHPATVRQRRDEQLSTLCGIVEGLTCDHKINELERRFLDQWLDEHAGQDRQHYSKLAAYLHGALAHDSISAHEQEEIIEHIHELGGDGYYKLFTPHMQELHGLMGGIASDGKITDDEVGALREWMDAHQDLAGHWPFTETDSLLTAVMVAGSLDEVQHARFLNWCASFVDISSHKTLAAPATGFGAVLAGITATNPEIIFPDHSFCVTGASTRAKRKAIQQQIATLGGEILANVSQDLDYLIYCDAGQKCWAYACYGRKVEKVMENRRHKDSTTIIVAEADYWDALADHGVEIRESHG